MAVQEFTSDTLEKLQQEGYNTGTPTQNPAQEQPATEQPNPADTPDIDFQEPNQDTPNTNAQPKVETPANQENGPVFDAFIDKKITAGGFKAEDVKARIIKDGGITPEFAAELKKTIDPDLVDTYINGLNESLKSAPKVTTKADPNAAEIEAKNARTREFNDFIYQSVGGQEKFTAMSATLKANLPQEVIDVLNAKLASQNKGLIAEGMKEAVAHYKQLTGRINNRMQGTPSGPQGNETKFMTKAEYHKIMTTEKYKTDKAYADQIDAQRLASKKLDASRTLPGQYYAVNNGELYSL